MSNPVIPIPDGYHSLQPYLIVRAAPKALEFYQQLFGATEVMRMVNPADQKIIHAELRFGDSILMISEESPQWNMFSPAKFGGTPVSLMHYVTDVDALFAKALAAGCQTIFPVAEMFWGDRFGKFVDPFGHIWGVATHVANPTPEEMEAGRKKTFGA